MTTAVVVGAGPAGLMAADVLANAGVQVTIAEAKPSPARKFLMAGKSGLNLTKEEYFEPFLDHYAEAVPHLRQALEAFGPEQVVQWASSLGQDVFTGSTGRVFPKSMKASPLLRAWLNRLEGLGVILNRRWNWTGWDGDALRFETPEGLKHLTPTTTILACGGASWSRLGSDGAWTAQLPGLVAPFQAANIGLKVKWTEHMTPHFGSALKSVRWVVKQRVKEQGWSEVVSSRGEAVLSRRGLEGGGVYPLVPFLRKGGHLTVDLSPDLSVEKLKARLPGSPKGGLTKILHNTLRLPPQKIALFHEFTKGYAVALNGPKLAPLLKALPVRHSGPRPIDEAISTAGGLRFDALDKNLMLRACPGTFAAGEMLDWEAPTGGYLITACLATGRWAGLAAAQWTNSKAT